MLLNHYIKNKKTIPDLGNMLVLDEVKDLQFFAKKYCDFGRIPQFLEDESLKTNILNALRNNREIIVSQVYFFNTSKQREALS